MKYRYIIYKIYSWTAHKKGETPIANTILTLGVVHLFHFATIVVFIDTLVTPIKWTGNINKPLVYFGTILYFILFYFVIYNKERWNRFIAEFENESDSQRKKGNILVISFLIGSILFFFISVITMYSITRR